jgi:hypothetical protein
MVAMRKLNVVLAAPGQNAGSAETLADAKLVDYSGKRVEVKFNE